MSLSSKIDLNSRNASRRFAKGTLCSILYGVDIVSFISRNGLFPTGFRLTHPEFGYNAKSNRVLCVPKVNKPELDGLLGYANSSGDDAINRAAGLSAFLKQNMILVYLNNKTNELEIAKLVAYDVEIDSMDLLGSLSGNLVLKSGVTDENEGNKWND